MIKLDKNQRKAFDSSKLVKMGRNRIVVPQLEQAFAAFDDTWEFVYEPKHGDSAWHPSGHCTPLASELYTMAKPTYDAYLSGEKIVHENHGPQKAFLVGHFWHQIIQYLIVKLELATPDAIEAVSQKTWGWYDPHPPLRETAPRPFHWVRGQGDIAPLITKDWTGLVDIKTMGSFAFKGAMSGQLPPDFAFKYYCQLQIYLDLFDQKQGMFLCVNKDSPHDMCEITYVRNQKMIDAIYAKWEFVSDCLRDGILPSEDDDNEYLLPEMSANA